jgi:hypothetical protein
VKFLFKLGIVLLVANALFRFIPPYWRHHEFESDVKHASLKWRNQSDDGVMQDVLSLAASRNVPVGQENVKIQRVKDRLYLTVAYDVPIELLPSMSRVWRFDSNVEAEVIRHAVTSPR